jgi:hypothetical protein
MSTDTLPLHGASLTEFFFTAIDFEDHSHSSHQGSSVAAENRVDPDNLPCSPRQGTANCGGSVAGAAAGAPWSFANIGANRSTEIPPHVGEFLDLTRHGIS